MRRIDRTDGCKLYFDDGWLVARYSGTEPSIRVFAESESLDTAKELAAIMARFLGLEPPQD